MNTFNEYSINNIMKVKSHCPVPTAMVKYFIIQLKLYCRFVIMMGIIEMYDQDISIIFITEIFRMISRLF